MGPEQFRSPPLLPLSLVSPVASPPASSPEEGGNKASQQQPPRDACVATSPAEEVAAEARHEWTEGLAWGLDPPNSGDGDGGARSGWRSSRERASDLPLPSSAGGGQLSDVAAPARSNEQRHPVEMEALRGLSVAREVATGGASRSDVATAAAATGGRRGVGGEEPVDVGDPFGRWAVPYTPVKGSLPVGLLHVTGAMLVPVPQRRFVFPPDWVFRELEGALMRAVEMQPQLDQHLRSVRLALPSWLAAGRLDCRTGWPWQEATSVAVATWLSSPWLHPFISSELKALLPAMKSFAGAEAGATAGGGGPRVASEHPLHDSLHPLPAHSLANATTFNASLAAASSGRVSMQQPYSLRSYSHSPGLAVAVREEGEVKQPPIPLVDFNGVIPRADAMDPEALYLCSPFARGLCDRETVAVVSKLPPQLPTSASATYEAELTDPALQAAASAVSDLPVADTARWLQVAHHQFPSAACAGGWCNHEAYLRLATNAIIPVAIKRRPPSSRPVSPKPRQLDPQAETTKDGNLAIAEMFRQGALRPLRTGEQLVCAATMHMVYKLSFSPEPEKVMHAVLAGTMRSQVEAAAARLATSVQAAMSAWLKGRGSGDGRPPCISSAGLADGAVQSGLLTERKPRPVVNFSNRERGKVVGINGAHAIWKLRFQSIDDFIATVSVGCWIVGLDWKKGFRQQYSHSSNDRYLGVVWGDLIAVCTRNPFGLTAALFHFCLLSAEFCAIVMRRAQLDPRTRGQVFPNLHVDDNDFAATTKEAADVVSSLIQDTADRLGVTRSEKSFAPTQQYRKHGLYITTSPPTLQLQWEKRWNYAVLITAVLMLAEAGYDFHRGVFWKVVGRNCYVSCVLPGGRQHTVEQQQLLFSGDHEDGSDQFDGRHPGRGPWKHTLRGRVTLSEAVKRELRYFHQELTSSTGAITRLLLSPASAAAAGRISLRSDASGLNTAGGGGVCGSVAWWHQWDADTPDREQYNSNPRELTEPLLWLGAFAEIFRGLTIHWGTDSEPSRYAVLSGTIRDGYARPITTALLQLASDYDCFINVAHFLRDDNAVCDSISKATSVAEVAAALRPLLPLRPTELWGGPHCQQQQQ